VEVSGQITIENPHGRMEVFVPEIAVEPVLLGKGSLVEVKRSVSITPLHPDEEARADGYWFAYIVKGHKRTAARIDLRFTAPPGVNVAELLDTLWLDIRWINYGPFGRLVRRDGILVALQRPHPILPEQATWRAGEGCRVLPLRTHLLGVLDNPKEVLERYAGSLIQPGDVLTIGETPLAVIQGRYHHPANVEPSLLARQLCRVFHPTSSLATACGLQSLIDVVGPARVLCAWLVGTALKAVGSKGWFYLASRPSLGGLWSQAGGSGIHQCAGYWSESPRQELVFIGQHMDQNLMLAALNDALLSPDELTLAPASLPDPFPKWRDSSTPEPALA
jgi:hypothetical protein